MSRAARSRGLSRVRAVPFWVAASAQLGCLADPPTFAPRGQIPPFIIAGQVDPPLGAIYEGPRLGGATSGVSVRVNVPFRSEDVNVALEARFYLDLVPGVPDSGSPVAVENVPAGNYEDERWISRDVPIPIIGQCHSLTLILTYVDNIDELRGGLPRDESSAARVVWWLNIGDSEGETRMADCPGASQVDAIPGGG